MGLLNLKKMAVTTALGVCCMSFIVPINVFADSVKTVTLGADLTKDQRKLILSYFDITDKNKGEYNFITVNNKEEREALEGIIPVEQIGTRTYSCACIEPTDAGGIVVETTNLNYVTNSMIASALTTAGVANCKVQAASPFEVSGTGALTGAMKAYEVATSEELDEEKKTLANEEIKTSVDLADEIGQDEATSVINDSKESVIEKSEKKDLTEDDVRKIVDEELAKRNLTLSDENKQKLVVLLVKVSDQDYDLGVVKNNLDKITEELSDTVNDLSNKVDELKNKDALTESDKNFFTSLVDSIKEFFSSLFGGNKADGSDSATEITTEDTLTNTESQVSSSSESNNDTTGGKGYDFSKDQPR